jgi:hypothetical protein
LTALGAIGYYTSPTIRVTCISRFRRGASGDPRGCTVSVLSHRGRLSLISAASGLAVVFSIGAGGSLSRVSASNSGAGTSVATGAVPANAVSEVDCNGLSPKYKPVKTDFGGLCTDPIHIYDGWTSKFYDNGRYIGHDEPSVKFISSAPGSAVTQTYVMQLATDPHATPTATSPKVSDYAELSPAPWFGLPICDPKSYPQNPCTPDSDTNSGLISDPNAAGSAFMELQFYPPGYQPFVDAPSCDATHYCAALTIDSLEYTFNFASVNPNCVEPVNFAYLQTNGVPAGPPSPQLTNIATFTPNAKTLMMNPGDVLAVTITDTTNGLLTRVHDVTTGKTGFIVASAANGFMNTNIADCSGTPFNFHPEYSSAKQQNQVPWAALEGGVLMEDELGHFEPCSSVTNSFPVNDTFPGGSTFSDANVYQTCQGGFEASSSGEGPCDPTTGNCTNPTTENGATCPKDNFTTGVNCEFSDAFCMPAGPRTIVNNGVPETVKWPIAGCQQNVFQNGDLDFDGTSYNLDWPDGSRNHPTSFQYIGPFDAHGNTYPTVQFETDVAASEILCNVATGVGCNAPPTGATFYPFWTIGRPGAGGVDCVWNFGNVIRGTTLEAFGGAAEYGSSDVARYGGTLASSPMPNPQFSGRCRR